ncbi:MAG: DUF805 domain-containing protein [Halofilum sp. (in: g-proteobacteria)]|nr:DUF805 domain-containing protein [Halofilum sp. (in: g-proteobacteria)]
MNATVEDASPGQGELKVLTAQGRIGRMRYIAWSFAIGLVVALIAMIGGGILSFLAGPLGMLFMAICYIAMIVAIVLITIQRCHDFNATGWLALILLVPLAPIVFWFIPGTAGSNSYGPPPPPNSTAVKVLFWLMIVCIVLGVIGSIAMPTAMMGHMQMQMPVQ